MSTSLALRSVIGTAAKDRGALSDIELMKKIVEA
jgi:hypothetical protein